MCKEDLCEVRRIDAPSILMCQTQGQAIAASPEVLRPGFKVKRIRCADDEGDA